MNDVTLLRRAAPKPYGDVRLLICNNASLTLPSNREGCSTRRSGRRGIAGRFRWERLSDD